MRRFYTLAGVRNISEGEIRIIKKKAIAGDPIACYKMAQLHMAWHWETNYVEVADQFLQNAQKGGVVDADVLQALMLYRGEGEYNPGKATSLLRSALEKQNEYAMFTHLQNLIYGRFGMDKNLDLANQILEMMLEADDCPQWHMLSGDALYASGRREEAVDHYEKALEGGLTEVYGDLAIARGIELDGTLVDWDAMMDTLEEGNDEEDVASMYYTALEDCSLYEQCEDDETEEKDTLRELILSYLQICTEYKHAGAYELLGDIYREGLYDVPADCQKALDHYVLGAEFNQGSCYAKMHQMLSDDTADNQESLDSLALLGARLHDESMIIETVKAYQEGRLRDYVTEIERYHLPAYMRMSDIEEEEEIFDNEGYDDDDEVFSNED